MFYRVARYIVRSFFIIFFKMEVVGEEVIPKNEPFILAANHLSYLDPPVLGSAAPVKLCYLAKKELFSNRFSAWVMRLCNAIALNKEGADVGAMREALKTLKKKPLLIFPQGTRTSSLKTYKSGIGFLYKKSKRQIIAARIYGTDTILPKEAKFPRPGKIKIIFKKVDNISPSDSYEKIAAKVVETIRSL